MAEALVGHVQEGREAARLHDLDHAVPLGGRDVVAGGVVAAGVQHGDGAGRGRLQAGEHAVEVHAALGGVVVGVRADLETGLREQRAVVLPARVADQHLRGRVQAFEEVGANLEATRAAEGLHRGHAAALEGLAVGTEHQALDRVVVGGDAVDGQVTACGRLVHHRLFGGLHALEQRQLAVLIEIHPYPQVHLGGVAVGGELFVQTQDRVAGGHFNGGEEAHEAVEGGGGRPGILERAPPHGRGWRDFVRCRSLTCFRSS